MGPLRTRRVPLPFNKGIYRGTILAEFYDFSCTFEVHKLENIKVGIAVMGLPSVLNPKRDLKSGLIMRLECESETEKNHWVKAINYEVKQLRTMAKNLSSQHFPLTH